MPSVKIRKYIDSVYVIYSHRNEKFKVYTGLNVEDQFWNLCTPKKSCPDYDRAVLQITEMQNRILNASMKIRAMGIDPTVARVRTEFNSQLAPASEKRSFWEMYTTYLELLACRAGSIRKISMTKKVLEYFCSWSGYQFDIETFDRETFGRFIQYMLFNQKMADSTINSHVKWLRAFLKYAYPAKDFSWMRYLMLSVEQEVIALNDGELKNLIDADLSGWLETTRDLFIFLATTGMRFSDIQLFNPSWVTEEQILQFTQLKTGGTAYPPLYEVSRRVLLKYGGIPPQISNQKFNDHLKELFEELKLNRPVVVKTISNKTVKEEVFPLAAVISSHTARRTFITLCLEKGMALQDVMKMSGHSDYKSMKPYIRVTLKHLRMVADKWVI